MPSKGTKIISIRVPERVSFNGYNVGKLITSLYDMIQLGAIEVIDSEIVIPEVEEIKSERFEDIP